MNAFHKLVLETYEGCQSIRRTAKELGVSNNLVRKVLITYDQYESDLAQNIASLRQDGYSRKQIAVLLHISPSTVDANSPYTRGTYKIRSGTRIARYMRRWHRLQRQKPHDYT